MSTQPPDTVTKMSHHGNAEPSRSVLVAGTVDPDGESVTFDYARVKVRLEGLHPDISMVRIGFHYSDTPCDWRMTATVLVNREGVAEAVMPVLKNKEGAQMTVHYYVAAEADCSSLSAGKRPGSVRPVVVFSLQGGSRNLVDTYRSTYNAVGTMDPVSIEPVLNGLPVTRWTTLGFRPVAKFELENSGDSVGLSGLRADSIAQQKPRGSTDLWGDSLLGQKPLRRFSTGQANPLAAHHEIKGVQNVLLDSSDYGKRAFNRRYVPSLLTTKKIAVETHYLAHWLAAPRGGSADAWEEALAVGADAIGEQVYTVTPSSLCATMTLLTGLAPYRTDQSIDGKPMEIFAHKAVTANPLATGDCEDGATTVIVLSRSLEAVTGEHPQSLVSQAKRILARYFVAAADCLITATGGKKTLHACALLVPRDTVARLVSPDYDLGGIRAACGRDGCPRPAPGDRVHVIETVTLSESVQRPAENDTPRTEFQARVNAAFIDSSHARDGLFDGVQFMRRSPSDKGYLEFTRIYVPELQYLVNLHPLVPVFVEAGDRKKAVRAGMTFTELTDPGLADRRDLVFDPIEHDGDTFDGGVLLDGFHDPDHHRAVCIEARADVLPQLVPVPPLRETREVTGGATKFQPGHTEGSGHLLLFTRATEDRSSQVSQIAARTNLRVAGTFDWQSYRVHVLS